MVETKRWIEIILMPLVVAIVGILGTYILTQQQEYNAQSKANSDRRVKILEIFAEKVTSNDENQRLLAVKILRVLDDDLAEKLASAVAEVEPEHSPVKLAAISVVDSAKARINLRALKN